MVLPLGGKTPTSSYKGCIFTHVLRWMPYSIRVRSKNLSNSIYIRPLSGFRAVMTGTRSTLIVLLSLQAMTRAPLQSNPGIIAGTGFTFMTIRFTYKIKPPLPLQLLKIFACRQLLFLYNRKHRAMHCQQQPNSNTRLPVLALLSLHLTTAAIFFLMRKALWKIRSWSQSHEHMVNKKAPAGFAGAFLL